MRRIYSSCLALIVLLLANPATFAAEGMWMPQQIPDLAPQLRALGFEGDPQAFADLTGHPMGAIVSLGGCTASFVSPDGLIVTNHHCVIGALQYNSTPERNLLKNGFLAHTRDEELWNGPGSRVYVTTAVSEVTDEIIGDIDPAASDRERHDLIERRIKQRQAACDGDGVRCWVRSYFEGLRYFETVARVIKDVRLVYAPAEGIGVFGGETDNFRWPRQTGDWGFYRAYVSPEGKSVEYSPDNVPYHPEQWLRVSTKGASPGDLVFVAGYPGRTERHRTYSEVRETVEWSLPRRIHHAQEQIAILEGLAAESEELAIKVEPRIRGVANGLTYRTGVLAAMDKGGVLARREKLQRRLEDWIAADPERRKTYGDVLPELDAMQLESERTRDRDAAFHGLFRSSSLLGAAHTIYRLSEERPKPDLERAPGYQERDWENILNRDRRRQRSLDVRIDRALLHQALVEIAGLPANQRIAAIDHAVGLHPGMSQQEGERAIEGYLDKLYAGTKLTDPDLRLELLEASTKKVLATGDSFIELAVALAPLDKEIEERGKDRAGARARIRPRYMRALLESEGGLVAPDANSTLRVTYGQVKGVPARDGVFYTPQTTLAGLVAKNTGEGEFDAPDALLRAIDALRAGKSTVYADPELGDVPIDFLSTVDTTGGNSGSPTLNARGELCGLLFDGTYESIAADYLFDERTTRSISVDSRFMLWVMTEVDGAHNLLEEMDLR